MRRLVALGVSAGLAIACGEPPGQPATASEPKTAPRVEPEPADARRPRTVSQAGAESAAGTANARSAWGLVRHRSQLLARRGDSGVAEGRLGSRVDGGPAGRRWLVDHTEGAGVLAVQVQLPAWAVAVAPGQRVFLQGAWEFATEVDAWVWRAEEVTVVSDAAAFAAEHPPGLAIGSVQTADVPADARAPHEAGPAGWVLATVVGRPLRAGDGWPVASEAGASPTAYLQLPGEGLIYGGDDLRTAAEKWSLRIGGRYLVKTRRVVAPRRAGSLPLVRATAPPQRVSGL